jgi:hypothetical protein
MAMVGAASLVIIRWRLAPAPPASHDDHQFSDFVGSRFGIEPDE